MHNISRTQYGSCSAHYMVVATSKFVYCRNPPFPPTSPEPTRMQASCQYNRCCIVQTSGSKAGYICFKHYFEVVFHDNFIEKRVLLNLFSTSDQTDVAFFSGIHRIMFRNILTNGIDTNIRDNTRFRPKIITFS